MARGRESTHVTYGQENLGCGLDPDSWHAGQDLGKREVSHQFFDFIGNDVTLVFEFFDLGSHCGDDQFDCVSARGPLRFVGLRQQRSR